KLGFGDGDCRLKRGRIRRTVARHRLKQTNSSPSVRSRSFTKILEVSVETRCFQVPIHRQDLALFGSNGACHVYQGHRATNASFEGIKSDDLSHSRLQARDGRSGSSKLAGGGQSNLCCEMSSNHVSRAAACLALSIAGFMLF